MGELVPQSFPKVLISISHTEFIHPLPDNKGLLEQEYLGVLNLILRGIFI